jgi:hypothetical protein
MPYLLQGLAAAEVDEEKEDEDANDHPYYELNHYPFTSFSRLGRHSGILNSNKKLRWLSSPIPPRIIVF